MASLTLIPRSLWRLRCWRYFLFRFPSSGEIKSMGIFWICLKKSQKSPELKTGISKELNGRRSNEAFISKLHHCCWHSEQNVLDVNVGACMITLIHLAFTQKNKKTPKISANNWLIAKRSRDKRQTIEKGKRLPKSTHQQSLFAQELPWKKHKEKWQKLQEKPNLSPDFPLAVEPPDQRHICFHSWLLCGNYSKTASEALTNYICGTDV